MADSTNNLLRMSDEQLTTLIERLNGETGSAPPRDSQRSCKRWPTTFQRMILTIRKSSRESQHLVVVPRNISTGGLACIHGGFLHPGTPCYMTLQTKGAGARTLQGSIVRCRHLERHLHDLGVQFAEPVDPSQFLIVAGDGPMFNAERVNPKDLEGTVLVAMPERDHQRTITTPFRDSEIEFIYASDGAGALALLSEKPSLVYASCNLGDMSGTEFVRRAAEMNPAMPVILVAADESVALRRDAIAAGAREMLTLPCETLTLLRSAAEYLLLGDLLRHASHHDATEPAGSAEAIMRLGENLKRAVIASDEPAALELTRKIRALAESREFAVIAKRAGLALGQSKQSGRLALDELNKLISACARAGEGVQPHADPNTQATRAA